MRARLLTMALAALCLAARGAAAGPATLAVELNRLENQPEGCRSYMVVTNSTGAAVERLTLDLVIFDRDGLIDRRLAVDLGPVAAGRTRVRVFDMAGLDCADVARVLVNEVLSCTPEPAEGEACGAALAVSARGPVDLIR
ncbi:Tat pathway signal sequence domain protein [Maritimibacter sp. 55A14]|uniref:Tat pathway signal sequence domain protein n=1 Tax=Maritimibacter sp. 55A14 TaxID=2174844 RepID=UPI000D606EB5|nr:Tat pathway signal sequence domain protein [Maritimibacter sp. 55A14]PWE33366.1 Tat pathway signal sequence domain protein [Maritimibacter sp. 55A14]